MLKTILKTIWLAMLCACWNIAMAATTLNLFASPENPTAPATVTLSVSVSSDAGPVTATRVEYFNGTTSLGVALDAPFTLTLPEMAAGTYVITAKATTIDPNNPVLQSAPLTVTVALPAGSATAYFVHTDQLNTPRIITNGSGAVVWQWDSDPFGKDAASEQPTGQPPFAFNMRFPGQYFDRETNLHYNYFRDYDPALGRYIQSDPIGLAGGINTYGYVMGNPISRYDTLGLDCVASGGTVSCNVPGGPQVSFTRPAGWPDYLGPRSGGYHYYNEWVKTAGLDKKCLDDYVRKHPTPGSPSAATANGTPNNASPNWVPSFMPSPVTSYAMSSNGNQVVVNVTMPGHPLFPGYVVRVNNPDGTMNNFGEGTGPLQAGYSPLARPINNVWQGLSDDAINACSCRK